MRTSARFPRVSLLALLIAPALDALAEAPQGDAAEARSSEARTLDQVQVIGQATSYAKTSVRAETLNRQTVMSSVNDALNEVPGVVVSEADATGSSVWGTQISMRGFVTNRDTQQIGTTIDGLPNGGSGYGGGSLANRYIDTLDLETVEVSQGTADISSRSNEALGGTLNFLTSDPLQDSRLRFVVGAGDNEARKYYVRYDTGLLGGHTRAWVSASSARVHDWIDGSGKTSNDHIAGKFITELDRWTLTGYLSYNDADEPEYTSVSPKGFATNPDRDNLVGTLTGIPYLDQNYRSGSRALRENTFGYLRAAFDGGNGFKASVAAYGHRMQGRGDWLPPYLAQVSDEGTGRPESEYVGGKTVYGGSNRGQIFFVNPDGSAAQRLASCTPRLGFTAEYDPNCYAGNVLGAQSYRHTHYDNDRMGVTTDVEWRQTFGAVDNTIRGGLWVEKLDRSARRDWHRLLNVGQDIAFDHQPYWVQFEDKYKVDEQMYYVEDVARFGPFSARLGVKQFFVDQSRRRVIGASDHVTSDSKSDPLLSTGFTWAPGVEGMELFAGFSQNFAAIPSGVLGETDPQRFRNVEPETADNIEVGMRISRWPLTASVTLYKIKFDNRIVYLPAGFVSGIDYLGETDGVYENFGGVESNGLEAAFGYGWDNGWRLNAAYTYNRSKYLGSGDAARDTQLGIVDGAKVIGQPEQTLVLSADWQGESWNLGLSGRYLGTRYLDAANVNKLPSATVFNANIGFDLQGLSPRLKGMGANLVVSNLTDKRYLAGVDGRDNAFIGAPRTVGISFRVDL
ncbi:TPA: TonB-dependent receptor [Stenotrophomonas maltophilia]|uniref:TonB-dependent receptor domain-containing protein n=1 Tax=Stenotrophomonas TaxID=40323 RepID=UPI001AA0DBB0|nr:MULTISPECIES: TonB-dependent receptor [Stenotrophomonas]ELF4108734.1 TonB-dependent receptor [Stenotrophomonas maltophilia]MBO1743681.1 TonB-dependent receptor [Stenotrophomonas maltophilia]MCU1172900.1 TonB-dependent receptor [Stenotrophomonas maltophilia]WAP03499.1 TonB-dependent receptor [Stenotrophomonas sp. SBJS02]HEA4090951.1 TonB-dependent receptor [Stenotrophomonas maltophilia]